MKQLADGSFVAVSVPTKNISGQRYLLSNDDIIARQEEEAAEAAKRLAKDKLAKRQAALAAKWPDPFALLDDILERGIDPVKTERNQIKIANPKED